MAELGAMKPADILAILQRAGYVIVRRRGSHVSLRAPGRQALTLALHSSELSPGLVRKILIRDAGLSDNEIQALR